MSKIMAPFAPFLSEHIFLQLKTFGEDMEQSVHLCDYPIFDKNKIDASLEDAVIRMQELIILGRQKRNQVNIKVKTPLQSLTVIHASSDQLDGISKLENYIKTELNVKAVSYSTDEDSFIKLFAKPNSRVLGKRLGKSFGKMMGMIKGIKSETLKEYESKGSMKLGDEVLSGDDLFVYREPLDGLEVLSNKWITIDMDTNLTDDLINEGLAREVVNRIQKSRKELNFNVDDRIKIKFTGNERIKSVIMQFQEYIKKETLTLTIENTEFTGQKLSFEIDQMNLEMEISKS
jgi:isoleucyl-tRNA synthetase